MADDKDEAVKSTALSVDDALKMYEVYKAHWEENYREAEIDLKMYNGDRATHYGQGWDDKYVVPTTTMVVDNELPQYVHQVTNDIRQNTPSIKVLPEADGDIETAKVFSGLIRGIEYKSAADEAYDTAADYAVKCGIGFIKADHDFCDDETDLQEMQVKSVPDPLTVYNDPATMEWDGRDSNGQIALEPISKKEFEKLYPKFEFTSFTDPKNKEAKDTIILANIYIREFSGKNGKKATIRHYKYSGDDLLAETTFPGKYVPYTPVYGEMQWIDGKRVLSSLIRQARSPQRRLNHMLSKESQVLAQAPIAPIMAAEGTLVNERKQWQSPGLENALEYRLQDLDGNNAPPPTRLQPPGASSGFLEAIASAKEAIKASMGIYNAGLGKREGDVSGIALHQLDQSGDVATFHFPDNVRRSINQVGRILVEAIPEIYDTARVIQIVDEETEPQNVGINGGTPQDGQDQTYDLTKGKYHVRVTTGASFTTKRQEEAQFLSEIAQKDPNFMSIGGDILFKSMDTPGAQALAARYRKTINPQLLDDKDQPQIPPQLMQKMQQQDQIIQQGAQQMRAMQKQLDDKNRELDIKQDEAAAKLITSKASMLTALSSAKEGSTPQQPQAQGESMAFTDSSQIDAEIQKLLQHKQDMETQQQNQAVAAQQQQEQAQAQAMQQQQAEALRQQKEEMMMQLLGAAVQQLTLLNTQVAREPVIMRDANGAIAGISYKPVTQH